MRQHRALLYKPVGELQPGEYVLLGTRWVLVESVTDGGPSRYVPKKHLAIITGLRRGWRKEAESESFDTPYVSNYSYMDSVERYLPAR